jgi:hypothetical protein
LFAHRVFRTAFFHDLLFEIPTGFLFVFILESTRYLLGGFGLRKSRTEYNIRNTNRVLSGSSRGSVVGRLGVVSVVVNDV